jgi:hypothetical protein
MLLVLRDPLRDFAVTLLAFESLFRRSFDGESHQAAGLSA